MSRARAARRSEKISSGVFFLTLSLVGLETLENAWFAVDEYCGCCSTIEELQMGVAAR